MEDNNTMQQGTRDELRKTGGWIRFYAVLLFIGALFFLFYGFMLMRNSSMYYNTATIGAILLVLGFVFGLMGYFLIVYSSKLIETAQTANLKTLETGFEKYKTFFLIWGLFVILSAIFSLISMVPGII